MKTWIDYLKANNYLGIKQYLKNGGNPNDAEENGESVVCFAMRYGCDEEIVDLLIEHGADLRHTDKEGVSVFDVAVTYNYLPIIDRLLEEGFDVNHATRKSGFTPLMGAVCYGRSEIIQRLLDRGADMWAKDSQGFSAVDFARKMNKKAILAMLEKKDHGTD